MELAVSGGGWAQIGAGGAAGGVGWGGCGWEGLVVGSGGVGWVGGVAVLRMSYIS